MNTRERFVKVLTGEEVDRAPFRKIFGGTNAIHPAWEEEYPGIGGCIDAILGFEGSFRGWAKTPVNMGPSRVGPTEIIEKRGDIRIVRKGDGTIEYICADGDYARHTVEWPIRTGEDWAGYKAKHLDPDDPARFPENWGALVNEYLRSACPYRSPYNCYRKRRRVALRLIDSAERLR